MPIVLIAMALRFTLCRSPASAQFQRALCTAPLRSAPHRCGLRIQGSSAGATTWRLDGALRAGARAVGPRQEFGSQPPHRAPRRQFGSASFSHQSTGGRRGGGGGASQGSGKPSHYDTLGVASSCSPKEIREGYLRRVRSCHPDLHGDTKTAEFQRLTHAYSVLSDNAKRARYDANGFRDFEDFTDQEKARAMFRENMKRMWEQQSWQSIVTRAAPIYAGVYVVAHVVVFIIDIPANMLMGVVRLCGAILGM